MDKPSPNIAFHYLLLHFKVLVTKRKGNSLSDGTFSAHTKYSKLIDLEARRQVLYIPVLIEIALK
jgi:hypothetical protein